MATFVLVHGAYSGSAVWGSVARLLRDRGHEVFTPTLTGLGERSHLLGPHINLETHIQDIIELLNFEDLADIVLVGHSYGGMPITGVADREWNRIAHVVYVDAMLPSDGQSCIDLGGVLATGARQLAEGEYLIPPPVPEIRAADYSFVLEPQPLGTATQKLHLSVPLESRPFGRTYVLATDPGRAEYVQIGHRIRGHPSWRYCELPTGHMVQLSMPRELTDILSPASASSTG